MSEIVCGKCGKKPAAKLDRAKTFVHIGDIGDPYTGKTLESFYMCPECWDTWEPDPQWDKFMKGPQKDERRTLKPDPLYKGRFSIFRDEQNEEWLIVDTKRWMEELGRCYIVARIDDRTIMRANARAGQVEVYLKEMADEYLKGLVGSDKDGA